MASETVNGLTIEVKIYGTVTASNGRQQVVDINKKLSFTDGTGSNQIGAVNQALNRPLNTTNETLDLDALVDFKGGTMTDNNSVKFMYFANRSTTSGELLTIGGDDFATWVGDATDKVKIGPSGFALIVNPIDGYGITASTGDGMLVATSANMSYDFLFGFDNT